MTDIFFNCSRCTQSLVVDAEGVGMTVPCPNCGKPLVIPAHSSPPLPHPVPKAAVLETKIPEPAVSKKSESAVNGSKPILPEVSAPKAKAPEPENAEVKAPEVTPPRSIVTALAARETKVPEPAIPRAAVPRSIIPDGPHPRENGFNLRKITDAVLLTAKDLECEIDGDAAALIARSANGNPENAQKRLRRILQHGRSGTIAPVITLEIAVEGMKAFDRESQLPPQPVRNF